MTHSPRGEKVRSLFESVAGQEQPHTPRHTVDMEACVAQYHTSKRALIGAAAFRRDHAVSHRGFKVGCALMAVDAETGEGEYGIYTAYNFKLEPGERKGAEKRCAERSAIEAALRGANATIIALVTVSRESMTGDATEETDIAAAHDVLHPCRDCRDMLRELRAEGTLRGDTIICNVNDAKDTEEERTIDELLALYTDDVKDNLERVA